MNVETFTLSQAFGKPLTCLLKVEYSFTIVTTKTFAVKPSNKYPELKLAISTKKPFTETNNIIKVDLPWLW